MLKHLSLLCKHKHMLKTEPHLTSSEACVGFYIWNYMVFVTDSFIGFLTLIQGIISIFNMTWVPLKRKYKKIGYLHAVIEVILYLRLTFNTGDLTVAMLALTTRLFVTVHPLYKEKLKHKI